MTQIPAQFIQTNTLTYEQQPLVNANGFREYDARWLFGAELNLKGAQAVGFGFGNLINRRGIRPDVVVGHDYREYSSAIKYAFMCGLMAAGCRVHDIGMCTTPMAYFAQFTVDAPAVAMITASHNENGWTGVKMGIDRPVTLGPDDMAELKSIVMKGEGTAIAGGGMVHVSDSFKAYAEDLTKDGPLRKALRVGAVCGNGTAGAFAPRILRAIGCDVVEIDCQLDYNFPKYNPNPEDVVMLKVMQQAVETHGLDAAFGFDGDGDRCGVADNEGNVIYADKIGLLMARDMAAIVPTARFVVDVKSTGLFANDPVLTQLGATTDYYKTGHSYIKRRTRELDAVAGFEKSGHFFFRPPFGHGYDDGIATAISVCRMLDRANGKSLAELYRSLPLSFTSPSMSPHCADEDKYHVVDRIAQHIAQIHRTGGTLGGRRIETLNTVNGIRFGFDNGSWGLIRASSNKPELVVVCESMESEIELRSIFTLIKNMTDKEQAVGAYNQTI
jgi:phosphomannomutase / phosphoglucomutase